MGHDHGSSAASHKGRLTAVLALSVMILVVEVIGSAVTNSVALLADAGHVLTDVVGIALALAAIRFAQRPATSARTFGYPRLEILAAVTNAFLLFGIAAGAESRSWCNSQRTTARWGDTPTRQGSQQTSPPSGVAAYSASPTRMSGSAS